MTVCLAPRRRPSRSSRHRRCSARSPSGAHPDLMVIERGYDEKRDRLRTEIVVDDIRRAVDFMHLKSAMGGWRVVIVDCADEMNRNSANALLKILEEPPQRTLLLLVSHAPGGLLPTIRSRCRRLELAPLPDAIVSELIHHYEPGLDPAEVRQLTEIAGGSDRPRAFGRRRRRPGDPCRAEPAAFGAAQPADGRNPCICRKGGEARRRKPVRTGVGTAADLARPGCPAAGDRGRASAIGRRGVPGGVLNNGWPCGKRPIACSSGPTPSIWTASRYGSAPWSTSPS